MDEYTAIQRQVLKVVTANPRQSCELESLQSLLSSYGEGEVNKQSRRRRESSLHTAVEDAGVIQMLIDCGAAVDIQDKDGSTALHLASSRGLRDSVFLLIHNGSEVNAVDYSKDTPLHMSALAGHVEVVEALIGRGAALTKNEPDRNTALHYAVVQKRSTIPLIKLLSRSFVGDGDGGVNVRNGAGDTPLHHFIKSSLAGPDTLDVLEALILAGANVNVKNLYGERPLSLAIGMSKWEVALLLLCYDADDEVRINNVDGRSIRQYGYLRWKERYESSRDVCLGLARVERVTKVCGLAMATPSRYCREEGGGTTLGLLGWVDDYSNVIECVSRFLLSKA